MEVVADLKLQEKDEDSNNSSDDNNNKHNHAEQSRSQTNEVITQEAIQEEAKNCNENRMETPQENKLLTKEIGVQDNGNTLSSKDHDEIHQSKEEIVVPKNDLILERANVSGSEKFSDRVVSNELENNEKSSVCKKGGKEESSSMQRQDTKESSRKMLFVATRVEELPKDLKKLVRETKVPDAVYDKDFKVLLNILHFVTKKVFEDTTQGNIGNNRDSNNSDKMEDKNSRKFLQKSLPVSTLNSSDLISPSPLPCISTLEESKNSQITTEVLDRKRTMTVSGPSKNIKPSFLSRLFSSTKNSSYSLDTVAPKDTVFTYQNPKQLFKGLRKSGKGGFGTVFTAKFIKTGKKVAVKRMSHSTPKEKLDNYKEVKFLKMCNGNDNIVNFIDCYEYKDECWMVLEFLEGGTLTEARRGHDFAENEIAYVARELLKALDHVHNLNLVHRDVKSENIMMSVMGDIKLIDFGLCAEASKLKISMVGSPYWMPPEMLNRKPHSFPADIWSFGISLLELANIEPPNSQHKVKVMFYHAIQGEPNPFEQPERWSNQFKDFIAKCLDMDPKKRNTAKQLLSHPFLEQASNTRNVMRKILSEVFLQKAIGLL